MSDFGMAGCPDCPAELRRVEGIVGLTGAGVLTVLVVHAATCPWATRVGLGDEPSIVATESGVSIHARGDL
jgi:hypothetical protein